MSKYTYIVNIDNAVDVSHFRMYFHEGASRKKLSLYSIDSISQLEGKVDHIERHVDRNVFRSDENELVICAARRWGRETDINWWTLMLQARVYHACRSVVRRKVSRIRLIIVDNDNGILPEDKAYREEADRTLLRKGYVTDTDPAHHCISREWLIGKEAEYQAADSAEKKLVLAGIDAFMPGNRLMADFIKDTVSNFEGKAGAHSFEEVYASYFERKVLEKLRNIDTCVITVNGSDNAEKRMTQLKLVNFLVGMTERKSGKSATVAEEYAAFNVDLAVEAVRLKRYSDKISAEAARLKKTRERTRPEVKVSYSSMERIKPLEEEDMIGGKKDIETILDKISAIRDSVSWEDDYLTVVDEMASYEDRLKEYGRAVNEEFHIKKQNENLVPELVTFENEQEALKEAEEEFRTANENAYSERGKADRTYAALVDITNQLQVVGNCLNKLSKARTGNDKSAFIRILLFAAALIILPYSVMQMYIYRGIANGNMMPLVCMALLFIAVAATRPFAGAAVSRSLSKETRKLSELVKRYFEGLQQRQRLFRDNVDCMAGIWNAERKLEACREVVRSRTENNLRIDYHRSALDEYSGIMGYFSSFIDNYYTDEISKSIEDSAAQIDPKKDIADNAVYWIGSVVDKA